MKLTSEQQAAIMVMQQEWHNRMGEAMQQATQLPGDLTTFLQNQVGQLNTCQPFRHLQVPVAVCCRDRELDPCQSLLCGKCLLWRCGRSAVLQY